MSATASDQNDRAFGYALVVCPPVDEAELGWRSYREILEAFVDLETDAACEPAMWPFEWGAMLMRRVSPVQCAGVLDLRGEILRLLGSPKWRIDHPAIYGGAVMYYPSPTVLAEPVPSPSCKDLARFHAILAASLEAAARYERGLLFIGGWGWDYAREIPPEQQVALMEAGYPYVDRRVP